MSEKIPESRLRTAFVGTIIILLLIAAVMWVRGDQEGAKFVAFLAIMPFGAVTAVVHAARCGRRYRLLKRLRGHPQLIGNHSR